jgi:Ca2+-transporting ATPase
MQRPPRNPKENILNRAMIVWILCIGVIMMFGTLSLFKAYNPSENLRYAQTVAFSVLMMFQMFNVLNCRSDHYSLFKLRRNMKLIGAVLISVALQIFVVYAPFMNTIFKTVPLNAMDWLFVAGVAAVVFVFDELRKMIIKTGEKAGA